MTAPLRHPTAPAHFTAHRHEGLIVSADEVAPHSRDLAEETPVAMVFDGSSAAVMMASPSDIEDFAFGFARTEGFITSFDDVREFEQVAHDSGIEARFWLHEDRGAAIASRRRAMAGPIGCGLCGIDSLEQALRHPRDVSDVALQFRAAAIAAAPSDLARHQPLHDQCRAVHAAGFLCPDHGLIAVREDVGRHNALDKLIGALLRQGIDPASGAFVMTSRISVDLVQKAAEVGSGMIIAVSAPTSHAVRLADRAGMTLAASTRGGRFALYTHPHRVYA